jgi:hypothetical protein
MPDPYPVIVGLVGVIFVWAWLTDGHFGDDDPSRPAT